MTQRAEIEAFCRELKALCLARGFEIAGTCNDERIYGEITVHKLDEPMDMWAEWDANKFNFCYLDGGMVEL